MKLFQLLLLGSVLIPSSSYAMFEEELTDVVYKHWNPETFPLEKDKNTSNLLNLEKNKGEMELQDIKNNKPSIQQNISNNTNDSSMLSQNDKFSVILFKKEPEDKINWKAEKETLATKIYQYWEDKKDIADKDVVCITTACSILNAEYNLKENNFEPSFLYKTYSNFVNIYSNFLEKYNNSLVYNNREHSPKIDDRSKNYYFLRALIRHLYNIEELDNKHYSEDEYKEKAKEIITNHVYNYMYVEEEKLFSDIKYVLGREGTISSRKSKKLDVQQEKNKILISETNI